MNDFTSDIERVRQVIRNLRAQQTAEGFHPGDIRARQRALAITALEEGVLRMNEADFGTVLR